MAALWEADASAVYNFSRAGRDIYFQSERGAVSHGSGKSVFAVYDNLNHFPATQHKGPLLCPASDHFIPADLIDGNIALRIAVRQPMTVENSLANLIYANLKLKKLLEEYEALQVESRKLLSGLTIPYLQDGSPGSDQTPLAASIYGKKRQLQQAHRTAAHRIRASAAPAENAGLSNRAAGESLVQSLDKEKKLEQTLRRIAESEESIPNYMNLTDASERELETGQSPMDITRQRTERITDGEAVSFPWAIRWLLNLVKYLFSHKVETAVLGIVFLFAIFILSSLKSR